MLLTNIWLPYNQLRTKEIEVPNLDRKIALNFVVVKGIYTHVAPYLCVHSDKECTQDNLLGIAEVFEVKHMVLGDLGRYQEMLKRYFHAEDATKSAPAFRKRIGEYYDGIIDGEIVTLVFFIPNEELIQSCGTTTETTTSKSPESTEA